MTKKPGLLNTVILIILLLVLAVQAAAQDHKVNVNNLLTETQMMSEGADDMTIVWWIPLEFWKASFAQDPSVNQSEADEIIRVLGPYTVMAVVDGTIGTFGGVTYNSEDYLRKNMTVNDIHGITHKPLTKSQVDPDAVSLLATMKPVMESILGPMGENMHFLLFPGNDSEGRPIVEADKEGIMTVTLGKHTFKYRLPLGSLIPPKVCPVDGEEMNGAWKYCPWHGVELQEKK